MDENELIKYLEPIYRFCCKRLYDRNDAEELSSEIICHILEGLNKYQIQSFDAWVWRIAHNRYARFIDNRNKDRASISEYDILEIADYTDIDDSLKKKYETIFLNLHTLSSDYKNIFVDYYINNMSVKLLAKKYTLTETTIKWRLNVGRQKIKDRIGEDKMDKVYKRINWNTTVCNGNMDSNKYLYSQIARAICLASYEKPLTVEEISISTGIPTMYIEDEMPRLEYGDAILKVGNKYVTNFIIFSLNDRNQLSEISSDLVADIADQFKILLRDINEKIRTMEFYGKDFELNKLGYIIIPYILRNKINKIKDADIKLKNPPFPPRKDGGYGWFIVEETDNEDEISYKYNSGCNVSVEKHKDTLTTHSHTYYYWLGKYFDRELYHNHGIRWLCDNGVLSSSTNGLISNNNIKQEDLAHLVKNNLVIKTEDNYYLNFAYFTQEQFTKFTSHINIDDNKMNDLFKKWIYNVHSSFEKFVPKHLNNQISQFVNCYLHQIIGYVIEELINRNILDKPKSNSPLTYGIFTVEGDYINP